MKRGLGIKLMGTMVLAAMTLASPTLLAAELTTADYTAIQQLYARYNATIDRGDAQGWADTFVPDGTFMNNKGTEQLKNFVNTWSAGQGASQRHFSADLVITPTADGAAGNVSTILVNLATNPGSIAGYVTYTDALVKTAGGWRFKSRALKLERAPAAAGAGAPGGAMPPRGAGPGAGAPGAPRPAAPPAQ
jgi:uncharacterized protein (TIGR02246 family)